MAVRRINAALRQLNWDEVKTSLLRDDGNGDAEPIKVCDASVDDWNRYVLSSFQVMKSKFMQWFDDTIWIVEYPGGVHGNAVGTMIVAMGFATGTGNDHLALFVSPYDERLPAGEPNGEPDCAFGPGGNVGAVLPPEMRCWAEYHTGKVEIGVSEGWLGLERKATRWKGKQGVVFVLSIRLSPKLRVRQYRFEQRVDGQFPENDNRAPILDIDESAVLEFDAHQLLGNAS